MNIIGQLPPSTSQRAPKTLFTCMVYTNTGYFLLVQHGRLSPLKKSILTPQLYFKIIKPLLNLLQGERVIPGTVLFRQWKHKVKFHPGQNVSCGISPKYMAAGRVPGKLI